MVEKKLDFSNKVSKKPLQEFTSRYNVIESVIQLFIKKNSYMAPGGNVVALCHDSRRQTLALQHLINVMNWNWLREQNEALTYMLFMFENYVEIWNRNATRTAAERKSAKMRKRVVCLKNLVLPHRLALRWTDTVHEHITKTIYEKLHFLGMCVYQANSKKENAIHLCKHKIVI